MPVVQIILVLLVLALVAAVTWWQHSRADEILERWAQTAGVQVVSVEKRYLRLGPFLLHRRGQFVFRIVVRDKTGMQRAGWLRVGGWLAGVLSDKAEVRWDS